MSGDVTTETIETRIPSRLDRLPWSRFHWLVIIGLGTVWILDGLEVTIVGSVASRLTEKGSGISIDPGQIGTAAAIYVAGACTGALFFGQLTDRFGRKKLFVLTLAIYISATVATAFAFAPWYFYLCRFFTGAGIGGEYAAINSAIDELIPARVRGRVDLIINGSYWLGSAAGSAAALFLLDTSIFAKDFGWRLAFGIGAVLGLTIMLVRRHVPESPRWLFIHGREEEAEQIVDRIETDVAAETGQELPEPGDSMTLRQRERIPFREIAKVAFQRYPRRAVLGFALFVGQAFMYNALTFNLGTILGTFFGVASATVPVFVIIYAVGNFAGPVTLGRLFDTVGRKPMIAGCYLGSAALTVVLAVLLLGHSLSTWAFEAFIVGIFFLASAGASAAYLTVSEVFPMETRALAIAFFYAIGTAAGGISGPLLFGHLIASGQRGTVAIGFFIGAGVMMVGGVAELFFGVKAEQAELEDIAQPLTAEEPEDSQEREQPERDDEQQAVLELRARAEEERVRAAEHRAAAHQLLAGDAGDAPERAHVEDALGEIADHRARALDEEARVRSTRQEDLDEGEAERIRAAAERARAHRQRAESIAAEDDREERRHAALADAAHERAISHEHWAAAYEAEAEARNADGPPADAGSARAEAHRLRAQAHEHRALLCEATLSGDDETREEHGRRARECEELARAADERAEAGQHRAEATKAGEGVEHTQRAADRRAAARRREARIRERMTRRRAREREGLRRFRPGPPSRWHAPGMGGTTIADGDAVDTLEREIDAIVRAVEENGPIERRRLAELVGARYWGPGLFREAVDEAVADGRVRRTSRSTLAPVRRG